MRTGRRRCGTTAGVFCFRWRAGASSRWRRRRRRAAAGVDRRRHGASQEGPSFGRRCAAILRAVGQAGELSGRGDALGGQGRGQSAAGAAALPARELGSWREVSNAPVTSRFAALRLRPGHRDHQRATPRPVEWLLIEWPEGEAEQVPALHPARGHRLGQAGRHRQAALAHRAGRSGPQAGGRPRP